MKINKKLKYTFISSLTLIASAVSVVACGSKNKADDTNYTDFITSLNNNLNDSNKQKDFFEKNSSLKILTNQFPDAIKQDVNLSIAKDIDPENTYIFNKSHQIKLSDLEYGGIKIDDKKSISFTNNNVTIQLDDAFFVSKFDISVEYQKAFTTTKKLNYNLTSFFQLENTKESINLNFKAFSEKIDYHDSQPSVEGFQPTDVDFKYNGKEQQDPLLGLDKNNKVLGAYTNKPKPGEGFKWSDKFSVNKIDYYNLDFGKPDSLKIDATNGISFTYDSLLVNGSLQGEDKAKQSFVSNFYFIEDLNKLQKGKFPVSIDATDPLAITFYQK